MNILILMHAATEGPGTLGDFLVSRGVSLRVLHLYAGHPLPADPREADAIVSLGGPMNVYQDGRYPFLRSEAIFLDAAVNAGVPVLGICLGAQMIARACGGRVGPSPVREVGWGEVDLTPAGRQDPLLAGLPAHIPVLQWHEDTFELPPGGELLAMGRHCPNQAFRYRSAWGLQFHLEADREMISTWFKDVDNREDIVQTCGLLAPRLGRVTGLLYDNFLRLIRQRAFYEGVQAG